MGYLSRFSPPAETEGLNGGTLCCSGTLLQYPLDVKGVSRYALTPMGRPKSEEKLVPVMVRLAAAEVERIDAQRGDRSRSDYVRSALNPSRGAGLQPTPTGPTDEDSASPSRPAPLEPSEPVDVDAIGLRWLKSKTTREVRAIGDPWGPAIRAEVKRWAEAFGFPPAPAEKPQRRQGTITRPNGHAFGRASETDRAFTLTRPVSSGKRHADDCSCLSCKAPKAVTK